MRTRSTLLSGFCFCLAFFTRLPCPSTELKDEPASFAKFPCAIRMVPVAGAAVGALAAVALGAASAAGLPPLLSAPVAIGCLAVLTGAMHEDGLADCADGLFGGASRQRKLEIMRDSRIGTFGAIALTLALYLRAASLGVVAAQSLGLACTVLVAAGALSRTAALMPLAFLPPAREDGAGFSAGKPDLAALAAAIAIAALFALLPVLAGASLPRYLVGVLLAGGAGYATVELAKHHIGGQTGDVAGTAQQLSEIAFYLAFAARV